MVGNGISISYDIWTKTYSCDFNLDFWVMLLGEVVKDVFPRFIDELLDLPGLNGLSLVSVSATNEHFAVGVVLSIPFFRCKPWFNGQLHLKRSLVEERGDDEVFCDVLSARRDEGADHGRLRFVFAGLG